MEMRVKQAGGKQELTVSSQKEFLQLWNSGVVVADDLVLRGDRWVPAGELPWIRGMNQARRSDNKRLFWITMAMMLLGLLGVLYIQSHARSVARRTGALPPGSVRAVPAR